MDIQASRYTKIPADGRPTNLLALVKGAERYIFVFDDEYKTEVLRTLGRFAANTELSLTWYDAAVLSQKVRKLVENGDRQ